MIGRLREGRFASLALFLSYSLYVLGWMGAIFRLDGSLSSEEINPFYILAWVIVPSTALIFTLMVPPSVRQRLAAFNAVYIVYAAWTLWVLDAAGPFNTVLLTLLGGFTTAQGLIALTVWTRSKGVHAMFAQMAMVISVGMMLLTALAPTSVRDTVDEATVTFRAGARVLTPFRPITLTWEAEGIQAIHLNGEGTVGVGELVIEPSTSSGSRTDTLTVTFTDDTTRDYSLTLNGVSTRELVFWGGAVLLLWLVPTLAIYSRAIARGVIPVAGLLAAVPFVMWGYLIPVSRALIAVGVTLAAMGLMLYMRRSDNRSQADFLFSPPPSGAGLAVGVWLRRLYTPLTVLILLLTGLNIAFPYDRHHYNFFVGPINDVLAGRTMFVEGANQYGMLLTYALAPLFSTDWLPLSYVGFSFVVGVLGLLQLFVIYGLMRLSMRNRVLTLLAAFTMTTVYVVRAYAGQHTHPSSGALRYGLLYVVLLFVGLRLRTGNRRWLVGEYATLTLAAAWSLETGLFALVLYIAVSTLEQIALAPTWGRGIRNVIFRIVTVVALGLAAFVAFNVFSYVRSGGVWPHWNTYIQFFLTYGGGAWLVDYLSPWIIVLVILYAGLGATLWRVLTTTNRADLARDVVPFGVAVIGVMGMFYWIRVSFIETLGAYVLPAVFVAFYWWDYLTPPKPADAPMGVPTGIQLSTAFAAGTAALTILLSAYTTPPPVTPIQTPAQEIIAAVRDGRSPDFGFSRLSAPPTSYIEYERALGYDTQLADTVMLIQQYAPDAERLLVLVPPETATDALIRTGKVHLYPTSHPPIEDLYNPVGYERVLAYSPTLTEGDVIFIQSDEADLNTMQREMLDRVRADFDFEWLEITPSNIAAVRLVAITENQ
jgi:hypothetical protein